jgi:hypothetical protein
MNWLACSHCVCNVVNVLLSCLIRKLENAICFRPKMFLDELVRVITIVAAQPTVYHPWVFCVMLSKLMYTHVPRLLYSVLWHLRLMRHNMGGVCVGRPCLRNRRVGSCACKRDGPESWFPRVVKHIERIPTYLVLNLRTLVPFFEPSFELLHCQGNYLPDFPPFGVCCLVGLDRFFVVGEAKHNLVLVERSVLVALVDDVHHFALAVRADKDIDGIPVCPFGSLDVPVVRWHLRPVRSPSLALWRLNANGQTVQLDMVAWWLVGRVPSNLHRYACCQVLFLNHAATPKAFVIACWKI